MEVWVTVRHITVPMWPVSLPMGWNLQWEEAQPGIVGWRESDLQKTVLASLLFLPFKTRSRTKVS